MFAIRNIMGNYLNPSFPHILQKIQKNTSKTTESTISTARRPRMPTLQNKTEETAPLVGCHSRSHHRPLLWERGLTQSPCCLIPWWQAPMTPWDRPTRRQIKSAWRWPGGWGGVLCIHRGSCVRVRFPNSRNGTGGSCMFCSRQTLPQKVFKH